MIVLNSRQMIYVHLHKCGGTSIEFSFDKIIKWNDIIIGGTDLGEKIQSVYNKKFNLHKHSTAHEIKSVVGEEIWGSYRIWATVRSPYERITSHYNYIASIAEPLIKGTDFPASGTVEEQRAWVESEDYPGTRPWTYSGVKAYLIARAQPRPFSEFIRHPAVVETTGYLPQYDQLSDPKTGELLVENPVQLEDLNAKWDALCAGYGLPGLELVTRNVTHKGFRRSSKELLAERDDINYINKRYAADFKAFSYEMM